MVNGDPYLGITNYQSSKNKYINIHIKTGNLEKAIQINCHKLAQIF